MLIIYYKNYANEVYRADFSLAFGADTAITKERMAEAIATYERSLRPPRNRFDRFINGSINALKDNEIWGCTSFALRDDV